MASVKKVIEVLSRVKEGEACTTKEWDYKRVPQTVKKVLKEHDLMNKYTPDTPINLDMELADRFFAAGLDLAEQLGAHCTDSETNIHFSRRELLQSLKEAPGELTMGTGADKVTLHSRMPEDTVGPLFCASLSIQVDESIYATLVEGLVSSRVIDILQGPSIDTIYGHPAFSGTPFETAAGIREAELRAEALARAGRPGMAQMGMSSSVTEFGYMCGYAAAFDKLNPIMGICLQPSEVKTNYCNFNKVLTTAAFGGMLRTGCPTMIGGYSGTPEGAVIANIASDILQYALFATDIAASSVYDVRQNTSCNRPGLWTMSMSVQATSRNTNMIRDKIINQSAGPCTEDILYTSAAGLIATGVSGMELTTGPRSAGGTMKNYLTPLEAWFCADVFKSTADLSLEKALELINYLLTKYEANVDNQPKGQSFYECYDVATLTPSKEWTDIEARVREDLQNHGLPI